MTGKEKFLAIQTYEEFDRRREEFRDVPLDKEIVKHMDKIFPKLSPINEKVHEDCMRKHPLNKG